MMQMPARLTDATRQQDVFSLRSLARIIMRVQPILATIAQAACLRQLPATTTTLVLTTTVNQLPVVYSLLFPAMIMMNAR